MKLEIITSNRKGSSFKNDFSAGIVKIMTVSPEAKPFIVIDAFNRAGDTYEELPEPEVRIYDEHVELVFKGTMRELISLLFDTKSIAQAIRADLDLEDGITDNDVFDYEQYKEFSKKY